MIKRVFIMTAAALIVLVFAAACDKHRHSASSHIYRRGRTCSRHQNSGSAGQ